MTTNYPGGTPPTGPGGPDYIPPDRDAAAGCAWGWWLLIVIILILIIWWAGWGWGPSGGYWFRNRQGGGPYTTPPATAPAGTRTGTDTGTSGAGQPTSQPGMILPSGLMVRF